MIFESSGFLEQALVDNIETKPKIVVD